MEINNKIAEISQVTNGLINPQCNPVDAMEQCNKLARLLGDISGLDLDNPGDTGGSSTTENGLALSPFLAAQCVTIPVRTQQFFRGINQFFCDVKNSNHTTLDILYAGCGPYATLLFPLLCVHQDSKVNLTLIDIHESSIDAVRRLFDGANLANVNLTFDVADAAKWRPDPCNCQFDLIVSETMDAALKSEPQVAIFGHLYQYLKPNGTLIPESIALRAILFDQTDSCEFGTFFELNKKTCVNMGLKNRLHIRGELPLTEEQKRRFTNFTVTTEVEVFAGHKIARNASDITSDLNFKYLDLTQQNSIEFYYQVTENPGFRFQLNQYQAPPVPASFNIKTSSGVPYLYLFWQNTVWGFHKKRLLQTSPQQEPWLLWENVLAMFSAFNADLQQCIAKVLAHHPPNFADFEDWFLHQYGQLDEQSVIALNQKLAAKHAETQ